MPPALVWTAAIAALTMSNMALAQCAPDEELVGEDATHWYCMSKKDYAGSRAEKLKGTYCRATANASAERAAIAKLGLDAHTERFEMFASLGEDQKKKITHAALSLVIDASLASATSAANSAKSLNPYNVNRAVATLEKKGISYEPFAKALRLVAAQKGKPEKAKKFVEFVEAVEKAKLGWEEKSRAGEQPDDAFWHGLVAGIGIAGDTRLVGAAVSVEETCESIAYLIYASDQVEQLATSSDATLSQLSTLSKRLKDDVDLVKSTKTEWQKVTGFSGASPVCASSTAAPSEH